MGEWAIRFMGMQDQQFVFAVFLDDLAQTHEIKPQIIQGGGFVFPAERIFAAMAVKGIAAGPARRNIVIKSAELGISISP